MSRLAAVFRLIGVLLMLFSLSMLPPIAIAEWYGDGDFQAFLLGFFITLITGALLWAIFYKQKQELKRRDGFIVVVLFWVVLSLFGTIPFVLDEVHALTFINAVFETVSGLTTTGASVITHVQSLPHAIVYYRQQLHFLGGMGILVLAVAILPMLGVGGMQLVSAESAGPVKDAKLKPRIAESAKALWFIYVGLVVACALCYWWAGMSLFDAIGEAYSTVATGGFSMHNTSFAYYNSNIIQTISMLFMVLGAVNFGLHFRALQGKSLWVYLHDDELRTFILWLGVLVMLTMAVLLGFNYFSSPLRALQEAAFSIISVATTTGFTSNHFSSWPSFLPIMIMFVALVGGCAASTSGGLKMIRILVLLNQGRRELLRLIHPRLVTTNRVGTEVVPDTIVQAIWGFLSVFIFVLVISMLALVADGNTFKTSFGSAIACLSNTGASIGATADGFNYLTTPSKWILVGDMLAGRLEILTLLVIFMPRYWRK